MGFKDKLKEIVKQFVQLKNDVRKEIDDIRKSSMYSEEYKEELIKQVKSKCENVQEQLKKEALSIIDEARNKVLSGKSSSDKNQEFEIKLNNTLTILNTVGADMELDELHEIIKPFKDDYYTMKILRKIFLKNNIEGVNEIFGIDMINHNIKMLEELARTISHAFHGDIESTNTMTVTIALNYIEEV